ncbi:MAG: hypothetical protein AB1734_06660, partial [Elusimicrobiota bacterium]
MAWTAVAAAATLLFSGVLLARAADYYRGLLHVVVTAQTRTGIEINTNTRDWHAVRFTAPRTAAISSLNIHFIRANNTTWQVWVSSVAPAAPDDPLAGTVVASTVSISVTGTGYYNAGLGWDAVAGETYWIVFRDNSGTRNDTNYPAYQQITSMERSLVQSELDTDTDSNYMVRYSSSDVPGIAWQTASQRQLICTILYAAEPYDGGSYNTWNTGGEVGQNEWRRQLFKPKSSFWTPRLSFFGNATVAGAQPLSVDVFRDPMGTPQHVATSTASTGAIGTTRDWQNMPLFQDGVYFDSNFTYSLVFRCPGCGDTNNYAINSHQGGSTTSPIPQGTWGGTTNRGQTSGDSGGTWTDVVARDYIVRFLVDTTPPTHAILAPVDNGIYGPSALSAITGTVSDGSYNVRRSSAVAIKIQRLTPGFGAYWTGSAWQLGETWVYISTPNALTNFNWTYPTAAWMEHDRQYRVVAKSYDSVTNESIVWSTITFTADNYQPAVPGPEEPDSVAVAPAGGVFFDQLTSISGTAKDNVYHGAIQVVQYSAKDMSSNFWWGGSAFNQSAETWLTADTLTYDPPNLKYDWSSGISIMNSAFQDNRTYAIYTRARDFTQFPSENIETTFSTSTVACDRSNPVSITTSPAAGSRRSSLTSINGTAWDQTAGVNRVQLRIKRNSDNNYWNTATSAFDIAFATNAWFTVLSGDVLGGATTSWAYIVPGTPWTNGVSYDINSQSRDRVTMPAARFETSFSTITFTYDTQAPAPTITDPASLGYITAPLGPQTTVQGTVDTDAALVRVRLQDLAQGTTYWNEGMKAWQNTVVWNTAEIYAAGLWRLRVSSGAWVSGRKYELYVEGTDSGIPAANVGFSPTQRFWYDTDRPTSTITGITDGLVLAGLTTISGTAWDTSHFDPVGTSLDRVDMSIYNAETGQYFTGSGWGAMTPLAVNLDAGALNTAQSRWEHNWTITPSTGWVNNYTYELRTRARDKATNLENKSLFNPDTPRVRFTIDLQAPVAVATFPANAGIYGAGSWNINGTAADNQGLHEIYLCLRDITNSRYWNGAFWQPGGEVWFSSDNLKNLPGATTNFIYSGVNWQSASYELSAKAVDDVGRWQSAITTITFTIDMQPPGSGVSLPENNKAYNASGNAIASIQGTSTDDRSGIPNGGVELWIRALGPAGELQWPTTYWNGASWVNNATPLWLPATLTGSAGDLSRSWTYTTPNFGLLPNSGSGHRFQVQSRARDVANNLQAPTVENYFEYDIVVPTSAILNPADNSEVSKWQYLNGRARDPYPGALLDTVHLQIVDRGALNDADYSWWTGSSWTATANTWVTAGWTATASTPTWSWAYTPPSILTDGKFYRIISRARDRALNLDIVRATSTFKYDSTVPQSKLLDLKDFVDGDDTTSIDRLAYVHGEAWAGVPITEVGINIFDTVNTLTWENGSWVAGNTGFWNICSGKEYFTCSGTAIPPGFRDGSTDFRGTIRSRARTAAKTETAGAGRTVDMSRGRWPYSHVVGPGHGSYLSALAAINMRLTWGGNTNPSWARVRVENITDATLVQDWTDAAIGLPDTSSFPNYAIYTATYTVGFTWIGNKIYRIRTRAAYDSSTRVENPAPAEDDGVIVVFDQTSPDTRITVPIHGVTYNSVTQLSGTAGDNLSGVDRVDISIADISQPTTFYWRWWVTSGTWQTGEYFAPATMPSTFTWTYSNLSGCFTDGKVYNIRARAADKAANSEAPPAIIRYTDGSQVNSRTFRFDTTGPDSAITYPVNGQIYSTIASITGTSGDFYSTPTDCQLQLHRDTNADLIPDGTWSGSAWGAYDTGIWFPADSCSVIGTTATFSRAAADSVWDNGYRYFLGARAKDMTQTGNNQGAASAEAVFRIDKERPLSQIGVPAVAASNNMPTISGTATDNLAGIGEVRITVYNTSQGQYYDPSLSPPWASGAESAAPWVLTQLTTVWPTSATWQYNIGNSTWTSGARYRIRGRARDNVSNTDMVLSTATFQYDTDVPVSTVTYPVNGSHLTSAALPITISGTSFDLPLVDKSGVNHMRMYFRRSNGDYFTGLGWQTGPYELTINAPYDNWTYAMTGDTYVDGERYDVSVMARDAAGNQEAFNLRSTFVYDISRPTGAITYPVNDGFIAQTGRIAGTAFDTPNGIVDLARVRIRQLTGPKPDHYWRVSDSSWTVQGAPEVWNDIPLHGTLSPGGTWWQLNTTPWQSGETYEMNATVRDRAGNFRLGYSTVTAIKADFTAPTSTVTYPAHLADLQEELNVISGSASDSPPGVLDRVLVSYFCLDDICTGNYWNRAAMAWNSTSELFYDAALLSGNRWEATGSSTPTWVTSTTGIRYRIFAKGVDRAGNEVAKPGVPAAGSSHIQFMLRTPLPVSDIVTPDANVPHWRPTPAPTISGTAVYASTVQVRIVDFGSDFTEGIGNDDLAWNGSAWVSTSAFTGYVGVNIFNPPNWQWSIPSASWNGNRRYRVLSKAVGTQEETPKTGRLFVIDSTAPVTGITAPSAAYVRQLSTLTATVSDLAPGIVQSVRFRVKRQEAAEYWNWRASTFTALSGGDTDLTAVISAGIASYTTDFFRTGQAWERDRSYIAQFSAFDQAGNEGAATEQTFTIDRSSPVARIVVPYDADNSGMRQITALSGTAADNWGNASVQVAVEKWIGGLVYYFNGSSYDTGGPYWLAATYLSPSATAWAYAPAGLDANFESGYRHLLLSRAVDTAGNVQDSFEVGTSSLVIKVDKQPPVSQIVNPLDLADGVSGRYKSSAIGQFPTNHLRGTATDNPATLPAGLSASQIRLTYLLAGDTWYWTGASFSSGTAAEADAWRGAAVSGSAPTWTWDYITSIAWPAVDREYRVEARGMDNSRLADDTGDGNWEQPVYVLRRFIVDDTPPSVAITAPAELSLNANTNILGTANADLAGHRQTEVRISTTGVDGTRYWTGSGWAASPDTWIIATKEGPTSWYYTATPAMLVEKTTYTVSARALDYAGNYSAVYSTRTFLNQRPSDLISSPFSPAYNSLTTLSGTAFDNTGISALAISIYNFTQSRCYDPSLDPPWKVLGCAGDNDAPWVNVPATIWVTSAAWTYAVTNSTWTSGASYRVRARSRDAAGNWNVVLATATFQFDTEIPVSTVTYPADGAHLPLSANPITIQGTAFDGFSGVNSLQFYLRRSNGDYWDGIGWTMTVAPLTVSPPYSNWSFGPLAGAAHIDGERYTVSSWARDLATNQEALTLKSTFVYDVTRPTGAITYPVNDGFIAQTGRIAGTAFDTPNGIVDLARVRIRQ